ncbi:oxidoreductase [Marivirga lumbricoides]|uniref:Oxidoreductase n=1 Tax=Marivirga lumbricoides TaxID=1046115 RepID=A0A2T4DU24_9BACT|nr:oxidoreductase [Marivirga lumbricoides]
MSNIKVGLIGFGMAGRVFHAPLIDHVDGLELSIIRETKQDNIDIIKERYPLAKIVDSSEAILNDSEIDLVVIAVPNKFHYEIAKQTLLAGKHVVVDKPVTVTSEEAQELINIAKDKNKVLSVYQNRRWDSDFLTVQKVIDSGKLGRIVEYEAHFDRFRNDIRPNSWKEEGSLGTGLLYDLGSHLIDQSLVLFGHPESITADIRVQRDNSEIPDYFSMMLEYGKFKVTLKSGMLVKEPLPKYIVSGTEGAFVKYGMDVQEAALNEAKMPLSDPNWGEEPEEIWGVLNTVKEGRRTIESEKGHYTSFYKNVEAAINGREELAVRAEHSRDGIKVIEFAMQSAKEKRTIPFK